MNNKTKLDSQLKETPEPVKPTSRAERKKIKSENKEAGVKRTFWVQIRMIPIWLRVVLVALLLAGAIALGVTVGYGYLGDGNPADALKKDTWIHILDIIQGKES
ncbi:DNA-directed RNA polymerase subunit beta [Sporosarcina sp. CAU 1771]